MAKRGAAPNPQRQVYDSTHFAARLIGIAAHSVAHFGHEHLTWVREHRDRSESEARSQVCQAARARVFDSCNVMKAQAIALTFSHIFQLPARQAWLLARLSRGPEAERTSVREHRTAAKTKPEARIGGRV